MKYTFGFIGCGNMGGALCTAAANGNKDIEIAVCDTCLEKAQTLEKAFTNVTAVELNTIITNCKYVFIGVKPQMLTNLFSSIENELKDNSPILISMAAGTSIEQIEKLAKKELPIIRIMPNTPAIVGEGIILYCNNKSVSDKDIEFFVKSMSSAGIIDKIDENKIDAASAVSGCGPAFVYMFIEALADGAVECGIPRDKAIAYASQMLLGSAKMVLETKKHPGELKDAVCSPAGTTIAGVHALENGGFRSNAINAVTSAYQKTLELSSKK